MQYDIFISHASEDKDSFVRLLANKLQENRIDVWYDELSLQLGDSLRQSIDKGLAQSRIGIVVLSKHFFKKKWTNWELDGLVSRHMLENTESSLIIPIWHNITKEEITSYSPSLADKVAIISSENIDSIVSKIDKILNPSGSTLIIARQYLLKKGADIYIKNNTGHDIFTEPECLNKPNIVNFLNEYKLQKLLYCFELKGLLQFNNIEANNICDIFEFL